jgi:thiamine-phosphate pyrophosphorylase
MLKRHRKQLPSLWLMTDERMGTRVIPAIAALPRGSGIVFRHYSLSDCERRALFNAVRAAARRYGHVLILGGSVTDARRWRATGAHGRSAKRHPRFQTTPVHSVTERIAAERAGADLLFVSPIFATQTHAGARPLGRSRFGSMIRGARAPVIALGGMNADKARSLSAMRIYGWAAISALTRL